MKKNNFNMILMSAILIIAFLIPNFGYAASMIDGQNIEISMVNQIPDPVEPGDYVDIRLRIENTGSEKINSLKIELLPEDPFSIYGDSVLKDIGSLDSSQTDDAAYVVKYRLKVSDNAISGENKIKLKYTTDNWNSFVTVEDLMIDISEFDPVVELVSIKTNPETASPGGDIELTMKVKSLTSSQIRDVKLSLDLEDTTTKTYYFAPLGSANEQVIEKINPNEEKEVVFKLATSINAPIDVEKIPITLTYLDDTGVSYSKEYLIGIKIYDEPNYNLALEDKSIYKKSQKGTVTFSVANVGRANINFLEIRLIEQPMYYELLNSDVVYVGNLESDDFDTAEFEIYTLDSLSNKLPLKVELTYKDDYGKVFTEKHDLSVPIYDKTESIKYGLEMNTQSSMIVNYVVMLLITIFWISMIINLVKNPMKKSSKILWWIILIGTYVIGGVLYFLMARYKEPKN